MKGAISIHCERYLGGYLRAISNAMAQDLQQKTEQLGLTATQGMFLHHLWVRQTELKVPTYAKDLEEFFDIKHSTVSGILQRMESAGFLAIHASEQDRRCKSVSLTDKGLDAIEQTGLHIRQAESNLTAGMSEEEVSEFRRLLRLAANNLGVCTPHFPRIEKEESTP